MTLIDPTPGDLCLYCPSGLQRYRAVARVAVSPDLSYPICARCYMKHFAPASKSALKIFGTPGSAAASNSPAQKIPQSLVAESIAVAIDLLLPTDEEPLTVSSVSDFVEFAIVATPTGTMLYRGDTRIGAVEPCKLGKRGYAFHQAKLRHPRWKSLTGVLRVSSRTWIEYREDGSFQPYHLS